MRIDVDFGRELSKLIEFRLTKEPGKAAVAGIFPDKDKRSDGRSNIGMALAHEFGSPEHEIPERSHFRTAFKNNKQKYIKMLAFGQALSKIAAEMAIDITNKIASGPFTPLSYEYAKRKKMRTDLAPGNRTLIATGEYIDSIEGRVEEDK